MVVSWMMYGMGVSVLLALAALLVERVVVVHGGASRRVWAWAMAGSSAGILLAAIAGFRVDPMAADPATFGPLAPVVNAALDDPQGFVGWDVALLRVWVVLSVGLLGWVAVGALRLARQRRGWEARTVDGIPVLVSADVGPAVVGLTPPRVVLPRWALDADTGRRSIILRHEVEHVVARDPWLLAFAVALLALLPWNPALWLMAHRLRLSVEVDCDRRVLRARTCDVRTYGTLLLEVGARRVGAALPAAAFSRPRSHLEHRLVRMTERGGRRWRRSVLPVVGTLAALATIWLLPRPALGIDLPLSLVCPEAEVAASPAAAPMPGAW